MPTPSCCCDDSLLLLRPRALLLWRRIVRAKAAEKQAGADTADGAGADVTVLAGVAPKHPPAPSAVLDEAELEAAAYLDLVRRHVSNPDT